MLLCAAADLHSGKASCLHLLCGARCIDLLPAQQRQVRRPPSCRAYWISPFSYSLRAMVINEMTGPSWREPNDAADPTGNTVGQEALQSFDFYTDRKW